MSEHTAAEVLRVNPEAMSEAIQRFRQSLILEKEDGPGEARYVPPSHSSLGTTAQDMASNFRWQTSLNSMAQAAGLVEAGNTALGM